MIINATDLGSISIKQPNSDLPPIRVSLNVAVGGSLPTGGSASQVLTKVSNAPYDAQWLDDTGASWGDIVGNIQTQADLMAILNSKQSVSNMGTYVTASQANSTYYPLTGNPSGYLISSDLNGLITQASAVSTFYPLNANPAGYLTASSVSNFLTTQVAASTYQTLSGMGVYETISHAASHYYPLSNPSGYITANVLDDFLTTTEASEVYQTQANMASYIRTIDAADAFKDVYYPLHSNPAGYVNGSYVSSNFYPLSGNPSGFALQSFVTSQGYITASALAPYATSSEVASGYYPLSGNPAGYLTASALTPYATITGVASGYYPLSSNPAGYLTASALTPYATIASPTFTGDPKAPTPLTSDNDTSIATTAFVKAQGYATVTGVASGYYPLSSNPAGYLTASALTPYATLASPTFTGLVSVSSSGIKFSDGSVQTSAVINPAGYALLTGATFTGKVNHATDVNTVSINIGAGKTAGLTGIAGDIWIEANNMHFRDAGGADKTIVNTNSSNTFANANTFAMSTGSNFGITLTQSGNGGGLKITNLGTGESLRVEDETSPDATPFVISNSGRVGIGVTPDATVALTVDSTGIKVNGATLIPASAVSNPPIVSGNMSHSEYLKELIITINGVNYAIPLRVV